MVGNYDEIFMVVTDGETGSELVSRRMPIGLRYGRNGGCTAWQAFSGDRLGRVSGGGYDRAGALLSDVLTKMYGMPVFDGARGIAEVKRHALAHGIALLDMGDALWSLPTVAEFVKRGEGNRYPFRQG